MTGIVPLPVFFIKPYGAALVRHFISAGEPRRLAGY